MRLPDVFHFHLGPLYLQWGHRGPHDDKPSTGGLSFPGALTLLFIGLRLTEFIDWCWRRSGGARPASLRRPCWDLPVSVAISSTGHTGRGRRKNAGAR